MLPSFSTRNCTETRPWIFSLAHAGGYLRFPERNATHFFNPPGNMASLSGLISFRCFPKLLCRSHTGSNRARSLRAAAIRPGQRPGEKARRTEQRNRFTQNPSGPPLEPHIRIVLIRALLPQIQHVTPLGRPQQLEAIIRPGFHLSRLPAHNRPSLGLSLLHTAHPADEPRQKQDSSHKTSNQIPNKCTTSSATKQKQQSFFTQREARRSPEVRREAETAK